MRLIFLSPPLRIIFFPQIHNLKNRLFYRLLKPFQTLKKYASLFSLPPFLFSLPFCPFFPSLLLLFPSLLPVFRSLFHFPVPLLSSPFPFPVPPFIFPFPLFPFFLIFFPKPNENSDGTGRGCNGNRYEKYHSHHCKHVFPHGQIL